MVFRAIVATSFVVLLVLRTDAPAAELVVMNTDSTTVPGAKVYTVGVQVTQADVTAAINEINPENGKPWGPNVPLYVSEVDFLGNILNSQQTTAFNYRSLQSIQSQYIDPAALNNPASPGGVAGPPGDLGTAGNTAPLCRELVVCERWRSAYRRQQFQRRHRSHHDGSGC